MTMHTPPKSARHFVAKDNDSLASRVNHSHVRFLHDLWQAEENEQRQITQDLHNLTGQSISSISLVAEAARMATSLEEMRSMLDELQHIVHSATHDVRKLNARFRPRILDDFGAVAAIKTLVDNLIASGIRCQFVCTLMPHQRFDEVIETTLFRVVQEVVRNILVHSQATQVRISLAHCSSELDLQIYDNGQGFDLENQPIDHQQGFGLREIQKRVEILNGRLLIDSSPKAGCLIQIQIPDAWSPA